MQTTSITETANTVKSERSQMEKAPRLSQRGLTLLLIAMCVIPLGTIGWIWSVLPPAKVETLQANVAMVNPIPPETFRIPFHKRTPPDQNPSIIVTNRGDQEWTLVNVRINKWFEFYETHHPVPPGGQLEVLLHRCRGKDGTPFNALSSPVEDVRIFARLPSGSRATFTQRFDPAAK